MGYINRYSYIKVGAMPIIKHMTTGALFKMLWKKDNNTTNITELFATLHDLSCLL